MSARVQNIDYGNYYKWRKKIILSEDAYLPDH